GSVAGRRRGGRGRSGRRGARRSRGVLVEPPPSGRRSPAPPRGRRLNLCTMPYGLFRSASGFGLSPSFGLSSSLGLSPGLGGSFSFGGALASSFFMSTGLA